MRHIIPFKS